MSTSDFRKQRPSLRRVGAGLICLLLVAGFFIGCSGTAPSEEDVTLRAMTYNIEDVRTEDLQRDDHPRLQRAAARIQHLAPDILLLNEITYDQPGAPGYEEGAPEGQNGQRFAERYLDAPQADTLEGRTYQAVMLPVNTGLASEYDLDNNGEVVTEVPEVPGPPADGGVAPQTEEGRVYGGDAWGFGMFPGQYGMTLLVRDDLEILHDSIRTFRLFRWSEMPDAAEPIDSTTGDPWYSAEEWETMRLSSKSHWDIPVRLPTGHVLHVLASHPTPPAFDGPARRNARRNHDEIRLWSDYLDDAAYLEDDSSRAGGLHDGASFVVMGDLNADPDDPDTFRDAIRHLIDHPRIHGQEPPTASSAAQEAFPDLDPDDTAQWGRRVDYVLPSSDLSVLQRGLWRPTSPDTIDVPVSDHFPVWVDVAME